MGRGPSEGKREPAQASRNKLSATETGNPTTSIIEAHLSEFLRGRTPVQVPHNSGSRVGCSMTGMNIEGPHVAL